ncbi:PAN domain-containing protein [Rhizobium sp. 3T7]|uniref:PAN domain-containing protein n=1 Tax=Rhizobium sp. 3T7 TaxID=2874922 RepID=UPI001CC8EEDE|nr:PAN domain-containing protein [Rhizobium sp. 3T7]MBZ9791693.1 PAN domain-containing protein [Rhizobium sp. 3T7]
MGMKWIRNRTRCGPVALLATAAICLAAGSAFGADPTSQQLFNYRETLLKGSVSASITKSEDDCRKICAARSGCAGFDHATKENECRLFESIVSGRADPGSVAATRALITGYKDPENPPLDMRLSKLKDADPKGDGLLQLSRDAYLAGNRGVGFEAVNLSMQRGNPEAKLEIAQWYDPRTFAKDRVDALDANKAARSYFELALGGNEKAKRLLTSICEESGNSQSTYASSFESFLGTTYCEGSVDP